MFFENLHCFITHRMAIVCQAKIQKIQTEHVLVRGLEVLLGIFKRANFTNAN